MPGINLAQAAKKHESEKNDRRRSGRGTTLMVIGIVLVMGAWGGLFWYDTVLSGELRDIESGIADERNALGSEEVDRIADTAFRLEIVGESLAGKTYPEYAFPFLESVIIPAVTLAECSYDDRDGYVTIAGRAADFRMAVEQLVALKKAEEIGQLTVSGIERDAEGGVDFSVSFVMAE